MISAPDDDLGRGRSLAEPAFPDDDGSADQRVRSLLAREDLADVDLARALRRERLLTSVVAVLDGLDPEGGDKDSHMAVVSMVNDRGERGLLAFTGVDSLLAWNSEARPVPAWGTEVALAAVEDGAAAVVIDVQGPTRRVLSGVALAALADQLDVPAIEAVIQAALVALTADGRADVIVTDARHDSPVDVLVTVSSPAGGHPDGRTVEALAQQAATILARRPDISALVPGGIGVTTR